MSEFRLTGPFGQYNNGFIGWRCVGGGEHTMVPVGDINYSWTSDKLEQTPPPHALKYQTYRCMVCGFEQQRCVGGGQKIHGMEGL